MSLSVLRPVVIISRQAEAAIAIGINHVRAAMHPIEARHIAPNQPALLQRAVQAVVTIINPIQQTTHPHIAVELRRSQRPRRTHTILMMMDMRIFTWMAIMTMKDTTGTAIMLMV